MNCRFCNHPLHHTFCDLGSTPLSNSYLDHLDSIDPVYPLRAQVCERCFLVQVEEFEKPDKIFGNYAYFSSYSDTWVEHVKKYTQEMIARFPGISQVVEIASNDGCLLQFFLEKKISVLGIEPAKNIAEIAQSKGVPTLTAFFGSQLARTLKKRDLVVANNVLAHVPDLNDFVEGIRVLLSPQGVATLEFPHLLKLIQENQFDTIYHEHFSYFSFQTVQKVFALQGLALFDVESIPTHGGSLRIYACHEGCRIISDRVLQMRELEQKQGLLNLDTYLAFDQKARALKMKLLELLRGIDSIAAYGAPAKGNTLLNYCGIRRDQIAFTVDRSPHKQGKFLPGTRIPIFSPDQIRKKKPKYVLILPWNIKEEIMQQLAYIKEWNGQFILPIPEPAIVS